MYLLIFTTIVLVTIGVDCTLFTISGPVWKNEVEFCALDGEYKHHYTFFLGKLCEYDVDYQDINIVTTTVIAEGDLQMGNKERWWNYTQLPLSLVSEHSDYKQFTGNIKTNPAVFHSILPSQEILWAKQLVEIELKVKFQDNGKIYLDSYVTAGSSLTKVCAKSKAYIERITVY